MDGFAAFEDLFLGRDPARIARHVRAPETIGLHASRYWPLEAALWDIAGQVAGQPVAALFGGARQRIPAYASFGEIKSPAQRADVVIAAREAGFRAVKIRIDRADLASGVAAVRAGCRSVPQRPGLGAEIDQDAVRRWA